MNYQTILDTIKAEIQPVIGQGKVATYIPALARVPIERFGMALRTIDHEVATVGDAAEPFSIQSVSKLFTLTLAMELLGEQVWERIGREPSGDPFNSLVQLEHEAGKPRNPFINAGAICIADRLVSATGDAKGAILEFVSMLCGETIGFDTEVAQSEKAWGHRNAALANFIKSFGKLDNDVDTVLDVYFHQCSLTMCCRQLATAAGFLANGGVCPLTGERIVTARQTRRINALMLTCGLYDAAGEFAFSVGIPGKSGVGGGILAVVPKRLALCAWSPGLDETGNSVAATQALELFTTKTGHSIF